MREADPHTRPGEQRPGGRSARVRRAALDAALGLMVDEGHLALTMDAVAARAEIHKTTLYRRWGTVDALMREALEEYDDVRIQRRPLPVAGSFEGDLREVARLFGAYLSQPITQAVLRMMIAEWPKDPDLAAWAARFWSTRGAPFDVIIERAVARGELSEAIHAAELAEPLVGPMLLRVLITGFELDDDFLADQAGLVFRGLRKDTEAR